MFEKNDVANAILQQANVERYKLIIEHPEMFVENYEDRNNEQLKWNIAHNAAMELEKLRLY